MEKGECIHGYSFSCPICHKPAEYESNGYSRGYKARNEEVAALRAQVEELRNSAALDNEVLRHDVMMAEHRATRAEARVKKLEWLLEAERFWYSHPGNGSCWWDSIEREHSTAEAKAIWQAALAECGEGEHPGRKAMILVMQELRRAKLKYPHFANDMAEAVDVLGREFHELREAVLKGDLHGEHGVIAEAAQVGAVAIRIIEMAQGMGEASA